ncbi:unnamed protein product [Caenorhabditis sp. 36 PRJEB53466]|nr:unnamed protein product [Caenorhabditis sp. 36 PRJEB53466]
MAYDPNRLPQDLPVYYKNFFPVKPFVKWLRYNADTGLYFNRREFAFILADDVHLRYRSFNDEHSFFKALTSTNPHKLDIGAVYNHEPVNNKRHTDYQAVERELVFDIDLTDYDPIRTCCQGASVCSKCWKFMVLAAKILDYQLEDMFGFEARMWLFSGRRGIHCWVGDKKSRMLNNSTRSAIAAMLNLFKTNGKIEVTEGKPRVTRTPPFVSDAYDNAVKDGIFEQLAIEQGWLNSEDAILEALDVGEGLRISLKETFPLYVTPTARWHMLRGVFDDKYRVGLKSDDLLLSFSDNDKLGRDRYALLRFVLQRCYPRLDVNVTTGTNHLLKSPFCVHPGTGNIAVPLDVNTIAQFDVKTCPRIDHVIAELEARNELKKEENEENEEAEESKNRKYLAYRHGILAPYVENFEKFIKACHS